MGRILSMYILAWASGVSLGEPLPENQLSMLQFRAHHNKSAAAQVGDWYGSLVPLAPSALEKTAALAGHYTGTASMKQWESKSHFGCLGQLKLAEVKDIFNRWQKKHVWWTPSQVIVDPATVKKFCNKGEAAGKFEFFVANLPWNEYNLVPEYHDTSRVWWCGMKKGPKTLQVYIYAYQQGVEGHGHKVDDHFVTVSTLTQTSKTTCHPVPMCKDGMVLKPEQLAYQKYSYPDIHRNPFHYGAGARYRSVCVEKDKVVDLYVKWSGVDEKGSIGLFMKLHKTGCDAKTGCTGQLKTPPFKSGNFALSFLQSGTVTPVFLESSTLTVIDMHLVGQAWTLSGGWTSYTLHKKTNVKVIKSKDGKVTFQGRNNVMVYSRTPPLPPAKFGAAHQQNAVQIGLAKTAGVTLSIAPKKALAYFLFTGVPAFGQGMAGKEVANSATPPDVIKGAAPAPAPGIEDFPIVLKDLTESAALAGEYTTESALTDVTSPKKGVKTFYGCFNVHTQQKWRFSHHFEAYRSGDIHFEPEVVKKYCSTGEAAGKFEFYIPRVLPTWSRYNMWHCGLKDGKDKLKVYQYMYNHGKAEHGHKTEDHFLNILTQTRTKKTKCPDLPACKNAMKVFRQQAHEWMPGGTSRFSKVCIENGEIVDLELEAMNRSTSHLKHVKAWCFPAHGPVKSQCHHDRRFQENGLNLIAVSGHWKKHTEFVKMTFFKTRTKIPIALERADFVFSLWPYWWSTLTIIEGFSSFVFPDKAQIRLEKGEKGSVSFKNPTGLGRYSWAQNPSDTLYPQIIPWSAHIRMEHASSLLFSMSSSQTKHPTGFFIHPGKLLKGKRVDNPFKPTKVPTPPPTNPTAAPTPHPVSTPSQTSPTPQPGPLPKGACDCN